MHSRPILLLGHHVRFLAQAAARAGFDVWAADCFGDEDTRAAASRWHRLPEISSLTATSLHTVLTDLSGGEPCHLICGSGVELFYPLLARLPAQMHLPGNSIKTIAQIKTPLRFFSMLSRLGIAFPETCFHYPEEPNDFLCKSATGMGGDHIRPARIGPFDVDVYYQKVQCGQSGSVLFLAHGPRVHLLSVNRQYLSPVPDRPYRLGHIVSPWLISHEHWQQLYAMIVAISRETDLRGINSLDFMLVDGDIVVLEVNPRLSASAELLPSQEHVFEWHMAACYGALPDTPCSVNQNKKMLRVLHYVYAPYDLVVPDNMQWPAACRDIPASGSLVIRHQPLCTLIVSAKSVTEQGKQVAQLTKSILAQVHRT